VLYKPLDLDALVELVRRCYGGSAASQRALSG
jgi:hypothetical protein